MPGQLSSHSVPGPVCLSRRGGVPCCRLEGPGGGPLAASAGLLSSRAEGRGLPCTGALRRGCSQPRALCGQVTVSWQNHREPRTEWNESGKVVQIFSELNWELAFCCRVTFSHFTPRTGSSGMRWSFGVNVQSLCHTQSVSVGLALNREPLKVTLRGTPASTTGVLTRSRASASLKGRAASPGHTQVWRGKRRVTPRLLV